MSDEHVHVPADYEADRVANAFQDAIALTQGTTGLAPEILRDWPFASLEARQMIAYAEDMLSAFEERVQIKRGDGFNRTWTFERTIIDNHDHMTCRCERGALVETQACIANRFTMSEAVIMIATCDKATA